MTRVLQAASDVLATNAKAVHGVFKSVCLRMLPADQDLEIVGSILQTLVQWNPFVPFAPSSTFEGFARFTWTHENQRKKDGPAILLARAVFLSLCVCTAHEARHRQPMFDALEVSRLPDPVQRIVVEYALIPSPIGGRNRSLDSRWLPHATRGLLLPPGIDHWAESDRNLIRFGTPDRPFLMEHYVDHVVHL